MLHGAWKISYLAFIKPSQGNKILRSCKGVTAIIERKGMLYEHFICNGFQDNCYYWKFHGEMLSLHMNRENIKLDGCYDNRGDIHDMVNKNFWLPGFNKIHTH